jgi:hypothetical protein
MAAMIPKDTKAPTEKKTLHLKKTFSAKKAPTLTASLLVV